MSFSDILSPPSKVWCDLWVNSINGLTGGDFGLQVRQALKVLLDLVLQDLEVLREYKEYKVLLDYKA